MFMLPRAFGASDGYTPPRIRSMKSNDLRIINIDSPLRVKISICPLSVEASLQDGNGYLPQRRDAGAAVQAAVLIL